MAEVLLHAGVAWGLTLACASLASAGSETCPEEACTLGVECERWGTLIEEADLPSSTCAATSPSSLPMVWIQPLRPAACPFGQCSLRDPQLTQDADGSLVTLHAVPLPVRQSKEGGIWFTRHTASGTPLASSLWDFSVPPPGLEVRRHGTLMRHLDGQTLLVSSRAVLPFDEARVLTARSLSRNSRIAPSSTAFGTPPAWGVAAVQGPAGEWLVSSSRTRPLRAGLTRYTAQGQLSWRRTWPEGHELRGVQVASDQSVVALVAEPNFAGYTLYKFDVQGVAQWRRKLDPASDVRLLLDGVGSIYVARTIQAMFTGEARILQLSSTGHARIAWSVADPFLATLAATVDQAGHAALAYPSIGSGVGLNVDWLDLRDRACVRTSYAWPAASNPDLNRSAIYADGQGARFLANASHIAQLSAGGAP